MRQLGKRLLSGDRAPLLAADGASLLFEAANKGDAEAAARTSALTALGLYRPQSWSDALRWLTVAAERGWQPAREPLVALVSGEMRAAHAATQETPDDYWRRLAATIDLARWQTSPAARDLSAGSASPDVRGLHQRVSLRVDHRPGARPTRPRARL